MGFFFLGSVMPKTANMNLVKLIERFSNEDACRDYLERLRWPDGVRCPRCDHNATSRLRQQDKFECASCEYQFSVTSGTIFHDTHLPLWKWFIATYLMCESKKGISAAQLGRTIGVSYKTAWYLAHRIRAAIADNEMSTLRGKIEIDETWIGGKVKGEGRGFTENKSIVVGAVSRDGGLRLEIVHARDTKTLKAFIEKHVSDDAEAIFTDGYEPYVDAVPLGMDHEQVIHSADEWVVGECHTNTVESVWSLLKRSIVGTFHKISKKHLEAYLDELEWRFNNRENPYIWRETLRLMVDADALRYAELTA